MILRMWKVVIYLSKSFCLQNKKDAKKKLARDWSIARAHEGLKCREYQTLSEKKTLNWFCISRTRGHQMLWIPNFITKKNLELILYFAHTRTSGDLEDEDSRLCVDILLEKKNVDLLHAWTSFSKKRTMNTYDEWKIYTHKSQLQSKRWVYNHQTISVKWVYLTVMMINLL